MKHAIQAIQMNNPGNCQILQYTFKPIIVKGFNHVTIWSKRVRGTNAFFLENIIDFLVQSSYFKNLTETLWIFFR